MAVNTKNKDEYENAVLKYDNMGQQTSAIPMMQKIKNISSGMKTLANAVTEARRNTPSYTGNTAYNSPYTSLLTKTMDDITKREPFQFDLNGDALYQQYRQRYLRDAQLAAQDTLGMTTALTGGYANSYAQSAAQQQYQNQIAKLNDVVPDIYQLQRGAYDADTDRLYKQYSLYADADDTAYGRYRDAVGDERYNKEWDYNVAQDERNWNYQLEQDAKQDDLNRANVLMSTGQYDAAGKILGIDLSGYQSEQDKKKALDDEFERQQREWTIKGYEQDYAAGEISNNSAKLNYALQMAAIGNYKTLQELGISPEQYQSYLAAASGYTGYTVSNPKPAAPVVGDDEPVERKPAYGYQTDTQEQMIGLYNKLLKYKGLGKGKTLTQAETKKWLTNFVHDDRLTQAQAQVVLEKLAADGYIKG